MNTVFIHRSIKTRIETQNPVRAKSGMWQVFIHRSIKTRIETKIILCIFMTPIRFLYIDPLKQGLKHLGEIVYKEIIQGFYT